MNGFGRPSNHDNYYYILWSVNIGPI